MYIRNVTSLLFIFGIVIFAQQPPTDAPFQVRYAANLSFGESYIYVANDGAAGAALAGPGLGGAVGNLCVNAYAFDQNEEMISCCSCLVTPDQVRTLGVNRDITSNTATGVVPSSVTVKLLATEAGGDGTGTNCTSSAASVSMAPAAPGLVAFGTTLHAQGSGYVTTETPFTPASLSTSESSSLALGCGRIIGNLSGFGICGSCRSAM